MLSFSLEQLQALDEGLFWLINSRLKAAPLDVFFRYITDAANYTWPLILGAAALLVLGRKKGLAVVFLAALALALDEWIGGKLLKTLIARERPCQVLTEFNAIIGCSKSHSFPSGHAANSFSIAFVMIKFYGWYSAPVLAMAGLIAYSRVYAGVHYPSDVAAGALLGSLIALALYFAASKALRLIRRGDDG